MGRGCCFGVVERPGADYRESDKQPKQQHMGQCERAIVAENNPRHRPIGHPVSHEQGAARPGFQYSLGNRPVYAALRGVVRA